MKRYAHYYKNNILFKFNLFQKFFRNFFRIKINCLVECSRKFSGSAVFINNTGLRSIKEVFATFGR